MAWIELTLFSESLEMDVDLNIVLPHSAYDKENYEVEKVIYLLHGAAGDCYDWLRRTGVERYATQRNIALVMPSAYLSAYEDMLYGQKMFSFITEELMEKIPLMFNIPNKREKNIAAGLSMGAYGALLIGLKRADLFSEVLCLSGAIDMPSSVIPWDLIGKKSDIRGIAKALDKKLLPKVTMEIGTEDSFLQNARESYEFFKGVEGLNISYKELQGGHDWDFWDSAIRRFIEGLGLEIIGDMH